LVKSFTGVDQPEVWETEPPSNPENRRTIRADAVLDKGAALALEPKQNGRQVQHQYEDYDRLDCADQEFSRHVEPA
jgi:hypothetical protein